MKESAMTVTWAGRWQELALGWIVVGLWGCGTAPLPPPADPPKPLPVPVAAAPAAGATGGQPANSKGTAKAKAKAAPVEAYPNESRANVFEVTATAEPMTTEVAPRFREDEKFVIVAGLAGSDSSQFTAVGKGNTGAAATPAASSLKLPEGFTAMTEFGTGEEGAPLRIRCQKDESVMALVPAGLATVGTDSGPAEAQPAFSVFIDAFYMDVTEVTATQFEMYRDELRKDKKRVPPPPVNANAGEGWPALGVSWGDAQNFLRWAGKELPTEAEFEKAARGNDGFRSPWGNGRPVWGSPRTPKTLVVVGAFVGDQSPYGIYDLAGNAREWTADFYRANAHQQAADEAAAKALRNWTGPKTATTGSQRVIKGGGDDWAVWHRSAADMSALLPDVSFRGVLRLSSIKPASETTPKAGAKKAAN